MNKQSLKATAFSPANIALIKYWGQEDSKLIIPTNNSISMNLDNCRTTTTIEFASKYEEDSFEISFYGDQKERKEHRREGQLKKQIERLRERAGVNWKARIVSHNSFPSDAGIAASASAFSALTLAAVGALDLKLNKKELSKLTRLGGSGSACRSIVDGFAEWKKGTSSEDCYSEQLYQEDYWDLADIVVVVDSKIKEVSSWEGHQRAKTSPYFQKRLQEVKKRIEKIKKALKKKDFLSLGKAIEREAISMHTVCMTSREPIFYWSGETVEIIQKLRKWRQEGLLGFFTIDAGPNVHVICREQDLQELDRRLQKMSGVEFTIVNRPCKGAKLINKHLF